MIDQATAAGRAAGGASCGRWARASRARHCGGVVGDRLLLHSGQDDSLLTSDTCCALHLPTATWAHVALPAGVGPRIDAAAASLDGLGLLVFGGVGAEFEFESAEPWLFPAPSATMSDALRREVRAGDYAPPTMELPNGERVPFLSEGASEETRAVYIAARRHSRRP